MSSVPVARPRKAQQLSKRVEIRVPKMGRDDMNDPDAPIHTHVGEDSPFKTSTVTGETPRYHLVEMDREEAAKYNQSCIDESKARLPIAKKDKEFQRNFALVGPQGGASMGQMLGQLMTTDADGGDEDG